MPRPIRLFVSCSPDLAAEREMLGRLVASLPVAVGWARDDGDLDPHVRPALRGPHVQAGIQIFVQKFSD